MALHIVVGAIVMMALCSTVGAAHARPPAAEAERSPAPAKAIRFDLPRQPLQDALTAYHELTGYSLLYDPAIVGDHFAGPLRGVFTAEAGLRELLSGTGIVARFTSASAFLLERPSRPGSKPLSRERAAADKQSYYAQLHADITALLCTDPITRPGSYRLALSLWAGVDATVTRVVIHPTGQLERDERIRERLSGAALRAAPPTEIVQPITLLILPRPPALTGDCAAEPSP